MGATNLEAQPSLSKRPGSGPGAGTDAAQGPTLGALVASASRDLSALVRSEIDLAKAEVKDDLAHAAKGGGMLGAAAFLGFLASIVLTFALAYVLDLWLPTWAAFLIVGVVYLLLAGLLALVGKKQLTRVKPPKRAIDSTKETVAVLKGAATS